MRKCHSVSKKFVSQNKKNNNNKTENFQNDSMYACSTGEEIIVFVRQIHSNLAAFQSHTVWSMRILKRLSDSFSTSLRRCVCILLNQIQISNSYA